MKSDDRKESAVVETPDARLYEYAVVRYVPRIEREEFINIGLIMMCKRRRWLRCEIAINEMRIRAISPNADLSCLRRQVALFTRKDIPAAGLPVEETYRWLTAAKSAILQTSPSHPGLACGDLEETFRRLFRELVE